MLQAQDPSLPTPKHPLAHFRNEAGAFDLPSILVGVVVVGILTAGVLAAIFGIIPFAQDKAAEQDLDATRTAEGVAKAKDGKYLPSDGLRSANLLNGPGSSAVATDATGSCYVAVSKSGSGKLFYSSSSTPSAQLLTDAASIGCITGAQLQELVTSVGGTLPDGSDPDGSAAPIAYRADVNRLVTDYMNAEIAYQASPEQIADIKGLINYSDLAAVPTYTNMLAAQSAYLASVEASIQYENLITGTGVQPLVNAKNDAMMAFYENPTPATQKTYIDALTALYNSGASAGSRMVAPAAFPDAFKDVTFTAGSEDTFKVQAAMPAGVDTSGNHWSFWSGQVLGAADQAYTDTREPIHEDGTKYWEVEVGALYGSWTEGVYEISYFVQDPATLLKHYWTVKVTVVAP